MTRPSRNRTTPDPVASTGAGSPLLAALCVGLLFAAAGARADLRVKQRVTGGDGKSVGEIVWTITPERARIESGAGGLLIDGQARKAWLYTGDRTVCTESSLDVAGDAQGGRGASEALAFEHGLTGARAPSILMLPRMERQTIAGVEAVRYDLRAGETPIQERWLAPGLDLGVIDALLLEWRTSPGTVGLMALPELHLAAQTAGLGFPLRVRNLHTGIVVEAIEISTAAQPVSAFSPPPACAGR